MKKLLLAISVCAAAVAYAQDNGAAAPVAAQNTGAAATAQATPAAVAENPAESLADLKLGSKVLDRFSMSASVAYESSYVFRGAKLAGNSINPQIDLGYDFGAGFAAYFGYWGNYEVADHGHAANGGSFSETDLYFGVTYSIKNFTFDVGGITYAFPDSVERDEWEIKVAASYDTKDIFGEDFNISPVVAYYYNATVYANIFEFGVTYSAPVMKWINGDKWLTIDSSFVYGVGIVERRGEDFGYIEFKSDVVVSVTDYCKWTAGLRCSWGSDNSQYDDDAQGNVWFGTGVAFGF